MNLLSWRSLKLSVSLHLKQRYSLIIMGLLLLNFVVACMAIGIGEFSISPVDVGKTLLGMGEKKYEFIIYTLRLPRVLSAFLVGIGLAVAGTILQALTRNPLASPGVIGLNAGAGLAAMILIVLFPTVSIFMAPFAAFMGAFLFGILAYLFAWKDGSSPIRLVLVGIGLSMLGQAFILIIQIQGNIHLVSKAAFWLVGSVYARGWEHVWSILPWIFLLVTLTMFLSRHLNAIELGDDVARGLGMYLERKRAILLLISVALAGASVAVAGVLSFVGLISPHIARRLVGVSHGPLIITSALIGSLLVALGDFIGRTIFSPIEIPCGIIISLIGAPYFLYLLMRK